jgi:hypothetical protein
MVFNLVEVIGSGVLGVALGVKLRVDIKDVLPILERGFGLIGKLIKDIDSFLASKQYPKLQAMVSLSLVDLVGRVIFRLGLVEPPYPSATMTRYVIPTIQSINLLCNLVLLCVVVLYLVNRYIPSANVDHTKVFNTKQ